MPRRADRRQVLQSIDGQLFAYGAMVAGRWLSTAGAGGSRVCAAERPTAPITQIVDLRGAKIIKKNGGWPLRKLDLSLAAPRVKGRKSLGACLKGSGKPA